LGSDTHPPIVLITGASSGIGRASALSLHQAGLTVYATARRVAALTDLAQEGIRTLSLDVTDEDSMKTAVAAVEDEAGVVDVLINNAGYGLFGPVEQLPLSEVRHQFETNFFGVARLIQLVLPGMRHQGRGRIVNVSSMGGRTALPGGAFYHASKYAVEALSDALRLEVKPFGIDVILIEPGPVRTPWLDAAASSMAAADNHDGDVDAYAEFKTAIAGSFDRVDHGLGALVTSSPEDVAKVITKAVTASRPRTRYLINMGAKGLVTMKRWLPDRTYDALLARQYRLPH
jgi:NAD(P)-dependent dehydrogenase (short-subunit alcohol dehydrogenase family)